MLGSCFRETSGDGAAQEAWCPLQLHQQTGLQGGVYVCDKVRRVERAAATTDTYLLLVLLVCLWLRPCCSSEVQRAP